MSGNQLVHKGHFYFNPEDPVYADHFPGNPVVPGSLIVHAFMRVVQGQDNNSNNWDIKNFRFKRFVSPGRYAYSIRDKGNGRLVCTLFDKDTEVVTGIL